MVFCAPSDLLDRVQMSSMYEDCKAFVDKYLNITEDEVIEEFNSLCADDGHVSKAQLEQFIGQFFGTEGEELERWTPSDFVESPTFLEAINDTEYRRFAADLNNKWKILGRKIKLDVRDNAGRFSLVYVPNPFIVPGGRFREFYYWDSYWVVQGLLICQLTETVKGMLGNFLLMVNRYGFVPNGGRVYYLNRSQPPFLTPMFDRYMEKTNDLAFLRENIDTLDKEFNFWLLNRTATVTVNGETHVAAVYRVNTDTPRPESYREDNSLAADLPQEDAAQLYADLASAAESGWDFSTRWYDPEKPSTLGSIATHNVIPVDLNAFLCWNAKILQQFHCKLGNTKKAKFYEAEYARRQRMIESLFWDEECGAWFDYHIKSAKRDSRFYASMITPMFTNCHGDTVEERERKVVRVLQYVQNVLPGINHGIPTSLIVSGQQWDFPNAWPPLQHMWVHAFHQSSNEAAQKFAYDLAGKWVKTNWKAWIGKPNWKGGTAEKPGSMYEKYNAETGEPGSGGEYEVQDGFGWTNGVILDFLTTFPSLISANP